MPEPFASLRSCAVLGRGNPKMVAPDMLDLEDAIADRRQQQSANQALQPGRAMDQFMPDIDRDNTAGGASRCCQGPPCHALDGEARLAAGNENRQPGWQTGHRQQGIQGMGRATLRRARVVSNECVKKRQGQMDRQQRRQCDPEGAAIIQRP